MEEDEDSRVIRGWVHERWAWVHWWKDGHPLLPNDKSKAVYKTASVAFVGQRQ